MHGVAHAHTLLRPGRFCLAERQTQQRNAKITPRFNQLWWFEGWFLLLELSRTCKTKPLFSGVVTAAQSGAVNATPDPEGAMEVQLKTLLGDLCSGVRLFPPFAEEFKTYVPLLVLKGIDFTTEHIFPIL